MESGNSSSMQSSSGGGGAGAGGGTGDDQEYESNVGNNNYFFNTTTTTPPQLQYHSNMQHFIFPTNTPQNNFLDTFNDQSNYQNIMFWQPQSQLPPQPPQLGDLSNQHTQQQLQQYANTNTHTTAVTTTTDNYPLLPPSTSTSTKPSTSTGTSTGVGKGASVASGSGQKNPRKRTRASRRAPTTVLTTDTTNFRAMVQEFTGIPSSPFSAVASPFLSRRLTDLFTGSPGGSRPPGLPGMGTSSGTGHLERLLAGNSNYPFRPSALKPPITNLPFQSLLQPGVISSSPRYNSLSGSHFHELSGILGGNSSNNQHNMLLSSTSETNTSLISRDSGSGNWRVTNDDDIGNIIANSNNNNLNNNEINQPHIEGTISGSGTTNYHDNNNNNNINNSNDDNTPACTTTQGTLGNFLG